MKSEFEFIESIRNRYSLSKIGDDCAVLPLDSKTDLVVTTDLLIEDIDFKLEWSKPEFIGHKALAVSLSDVAAMGGKPIWSMLSIGIPASVWETDFVEKFYDCYMRLARKFHVELVGGDVSKTPDKIVIDSIVAGVVKKGKAVRRSGAQVGDLIYVTGSLGGAAAGLSLLQSMAKANKAAHRKLRLRQLAPQPQIAVGRILGASNLATSMIDLSDGLSSDLAHICRASRVGVRIDAAGIPLDESLSALTKSFADQIALALHGGEDYELLFTVNPKKKFRVENALAEHRFSHIGEVSANAQMIEFTSGGKTEILMSKGFRHF